VRRRRARRSAGICLHPRRSAALAETAGVVLAGGRAKRFGRDKLAEPYRGAPLLDHAVLRLAQVCAEVVVVLPPGTAEPRWPGGVPVRVARDPVEGEGPLVGLAAGLALVDAGLALAIGGDMPDAQVRVLLEMLRRAGPPDVEAVVLQDGDRPRPLPLLVRVAPAAAAADLLLGSGRRRLRDLLAELRRVVVVPEADWRAIDPAARTLVDVDEPSDLER
jgi:molybdopterin-guanine dinucleotide biosynthesis protein A